MVVSFSLKSLKALGVLAPKWSLGLYTPNNQVNCFRAYRMGAFIGIFILMLFNEGLVDAEVCLCSVAGPP